MKYLINKLKEKNGSATINTGVKIIIAVVIGAVVLGGVWLLFAGNNGIMKNVDNNINEMMDIGSDGVKVQTALDASGNSVLQVSYDGKHWSSPNLPDYGDTATVYGVINSGGKSTSHAALIKDGERYHLIASADGVNWSERFSFTAKMITHFYYGTSSQLPGTAGSFGGNKFVIRYWTGGKMYYTSAAVKATEWSAPTWSDLIPV